MQRYKTALLLILSLIYWQFNAEGQLPAAIIYPAPAGAFLNSNYLVWVNKHTVPVYAVKVGASDPIRRFKAVDDLLHSATYCDTAAFSYFDLRSKATVMVKVNAKINTVKILPASAGIIARINGNAVTFNVTKPQNLTVEINGEITKSLHVFIDPVETYHPSPKDTSVIYFGPGIHYVRGTVIRDNKTVYVAGGAIGVRTQR